MSELSRSGSIRLDPVDSLRQLFLYRLRIQKCISWAYSVKLVPVMMTLTVFHRWHPLKGLLNVLRKAWNYFFTGTRAATERSCRMGLQGYIRRSEETINNISRSDSDGYNSGWHPHYHVILFIPRDKVSVVSDMEPELREAWFKAVNRYFVKEFGEEIDPSYANAFRKHGLFFSRCRDDKRREQSIDYLTISQTHENNKFTVSIDGDSHLGCFSADFSDDDDDPLRQVDDSDYMAKTFGCDSGCVYGGDKEMSSSSLKSSRVPFDLLLEDTAENNDLWVEYALATKGVRSFIFSHGLERRVKEYFEAHPERNPVKPFVKSHDVVAQLDSRVYHLLYQNFKVDEMLRAAADGYDALCSWFKNFYLELGFSEADIVEDMIIVDSLAETLVVFIRRNRAIKDLPTPFVD